VKTYAAPVLAALAAGHVVVVQLVELQFPSGTVALNTSNWHLDWDSVTYQGAYGLGSVSPIKDSPGEIQGISFTLSGGDSASIALALDAAGEVQGTPATIRTAILDTTTLQILDAPIDWAGTLDTMSIEEDNNQATINATAESAAVDLLRGNLSTYSDADQQALFPGDRAFEYVVSQVDQPVVWPAREYFFQ
jgi:hypothetical protein